MIAHASHGHALFHEDNSQVYYHLEEATRRTSYAAFIKPFQQCKDRQGAWFTLTNQNAVCDKWEAEIKKQDDLLHMQLWKGQSNFLLKCFIAQHQNAYISMLQCSEHMEYQLPNEHSRVSYLLESL